MLKDLLLSEAKNIENLDLKANPVLRKLVMVVCQEPNEKEKKDLRLEAFRSII